LAYEYVNKNNTSNKKKDNGMQVGRFN
jgi:hypothetical protein